jgi:hypothetical protein
MTTIWETRNDIKYYCNKSKILEIGVFKGEFLDYIVNNCDYVSVDGVDLFEGATGSGDVDGNNFTMCNLEKSFLDLSEKYKENPAIRIIKSNSNSFLQSQKDDSYDIIYIDADHSYEGTKQDLINSFNKIKDGGYIMGHDYEMNMNKAKQYYHFGVKQAVEEFCINYKQTILSKAMDGCVSFCIHINKTS